MTRPALLQRLLAALLGTRSLHRQLLLWLLLPQVVLWAAGAAFTYNVAARYARGGIDASLLQATRSLARQVKPIGNGLFIDFPRAAQDIIEADPADRVHYMVSTPPGQFILGNKQLPLPPGVRTPRLNEPYYYDARVDDQRLRVAALYVPIGGIGDSIIKAAQVDGASLPRIYWRILIPSLRPVFFSTLMVVSHLAVKSFDLVMSLTAGGPGFATDLPATFMYAMAFSRGQIGLGAAAATVMLATVAAIVVLYLYSELRTKR